MSYYIDMRKPAVVANSGFAVMWANVDKEQGGLPKEQAARVLRKACMWLNTDEAEESKVPMEYIIRPHASGYECIAYTRDADDPKNWRQRDIAETAEEAGALILKWDAFYAVFAKPAEEPEVKGETEEPEEGATDKDVCANDDGEVFRVGDRVRVVTCDDWNEGDGDILDGEGGVYTNTGDLYGKTGRVVRVRIPFAEVELDGENEALGFSGRCLRKENPRTFEEIVAGLKRNPLFASYECDLPEGESNNESARFTHRKSGRIFTLLRGGHFWTETQFVDLTPEQMAAVTAACAEIEERRAYEVEMAKYAEKIAAYEADKEKGGEQ